MQASGRLRQQEDRLAAAMRAAQEGDTAAYRDVLEGARAIVEVYTARVLRRMGKLNAQSAGELVQEVLLALHEKRHTYDPSQPFLPWLFAIARYKLIDHGRRELRRPAMVTVESMEDVLAAPVFAEPEAARDLERLLSGLPDRARKVLELVKIEGLTVAEAAARTGMSPSALKVAVHRAMKRLKARWRKESLR